MKKTKNHTHLPRDSGRMLRWEAMTYMTQYNAHRNSSGEELCSKSRGVEGKPSQKPNFCIFCSESGLGGHLSEEEMDSYLSSFSD